MSRTGKAARLVHLGQRLRNVGPRSAAARVAWLAYRRLHVEGLEGELLPGDVADSTSLRLPTGEGARGRARIGWVCSPPGQRSGGHTTLFRMVAAAEARGHSCVLFLYDAYGGSFEHHRQLIRAYWPQLQAEVRDATAGVDGVDACVASSWASAHALACRGGTPMRRLYFIQDYEPFFYPRGPLYALAEDTYRFGFRCIALGDMVADLLKTEIGVAPDVVPFACDTDVYHLIGGRRRSGVVFFARPEVPRRGFLTGVLALEEFHRKRPDQPIHLYGDSRVGDLPFPHVNHGAMSPSELNELYNSTLAGLALSFTNPTLVANEMLAAGCIPVANDHPLARSVLRSPFISWADQTPGALAEALAGAVDQRDAPGRAEAASRSVAVGWSDTQERVIDIIEDELG